MEELVYEIGIIDTNGLGELAQATPDRLLYTYTFADDSATPSCILKTKARATTRAVAPISNSSLHHSNKYLLVAMPQNIG